MSTQPYDEQEPVHGWFGLSYNHYLTVPRSLLQNMPRDWQAKFVALLNEMMVTPAGDQFARHHYLVRRTDPARDDEIYEYSRRPECEQDEELKPIFIDDPFFNYRYPDKRIPWKGLGFA